MSSGLKGLRQDKGITQKQLAKVTGIPQPKISLFEAGLPPKPEEIEKLAKALEVEVNYERKNA
ncbi:MAG: helix-turn-helix transcriptional regulator [Deltaproteobacteria bacterium]|nr:helix-turn-helix transcriptional regulator [Deltaproteobacteria bacterium]